MLVEEEAILVADTVDLLLFVLTLQTLAGLFTVMVEQDLLMTEVGRDILRLLRREEELDSRVFL